MKIPITFWKFARDGRLSGSSGLLPRHGRNQILTTVKKNIVM